MFMYQNTLLLGIVVGKIVVVGNVFQMTQQII